MVARVPMSVKIAPRRLSSSGRPSGKPSSPVSEVEHVAAECVAGLAIARADAARLEAPQPAAAEEEPVDDPHVVVDAEYVAGPREGGQHPSVRDRVEVAVGEGVLEEGRVAAEPGEFLPETGRSSRRSGRCGYRAGRTPALWAIAEVVWSRPPARE